MSDKLGTSCLEWKVSEVRERMRFLRGRPAWHLLATKVAKALNVNSGDKSGIFPSLNSSPHRYVSLSDNEKTAFKSRELKSVHVDAVGTYLRITFHRNHVNRYNHYNQVRCESLDAFTHQHHCFTLWYSFWVHRTQRAILHFLNTN